MDNWLPPFFFGFVVGFALTMILSDTMWNNTVRSYKEMTYLCLKIHNKVPTDEDYSSYLEQCKNASKIFTGTEK